MFMLSEDVRVNLACKGVNCSGSMLVVPSCLSISNQEHLIALISRQASDAHSLHQKVLIALCISEQPWPQEVTGMGATR